jgi:pantetheine-phosphate adenylyltransferase
MSETTHQQKERKAVYPGSFDPITNGHVDIIKRGLKVFDSLLVAVLENPKKKPLFSSEERVSMIQEVFVDQKNTEIKAFHGLLVEFAKNNDAKVVIRGLRAISDFEYEFQMALMNMKLDPDFLSSKLVKEIFMLGGCLKDLVPKQVEQRLRVKFKNKHPSLNL